MTVWYRYENGRIEAELFLNFEPSRVKAYAYLYTFEVDHETPKGVWLKGCASYTSTAPNGLKFVLFDSHKQWACPTIKAAQTSFLKRRQKQVEILEAQLTHARHFLTPIFVDKAFTGLESL